MVSRLPQASLTVTVTTAGHTPTVAAVLVTKLQSSLASVASIAAASVAVATTVTGGVGHRRDADWESKAAGRHAQQAGHCAVVSGRHVERHVAGALSRCRVYRDIGRTGDQGRLGIKDGDGEGASVA